MIFPVVLAGGSGSRLWPLSRTAFPKQFFALSGQLTMLQQTCNRLQGMQIHKPLVICNEEHRFLVAEQMRQLGSSADILLEPAERNTAPAIALAAQHASAKASGIDQAVLLVLAADHVIEDTAAFQAAVQRLLPEVRDGKFGTLGIVPTEPATGYGYIKPASSGADIQQVAEFVEKPDAQTACQYIEDGYFWNSGMFMVRADRYLEELNQYRPDIAQACNAAMADVFHDMDFIRVNKAAFEACPDESIDYAVMEPLCVAGNSVVVTALDAGWSDVGSWSALWEISDKDSNSNAVTGAGETILKDTSGSYVYSQDRLVTTLGVDDLVVIDTPDALLVASKDKVQDVKSIVAEIKASGRSEHHQHRKVYRPWGKYDSIDNGERYQVKRITVNPGAKLSLQMHHHRAEHWIVVSGTAKVTNGDQTFLVGENESTFIPIGVTHSLENPGMIPLELIEVQSGSYLGEDDIVRFEDLYGRN